MRRVYSLLLALVAFFAIGCGSSFNPDGFFPDDPIPPGADASYLRVANLSPDSAALEFYLDDERLSTRNFEEFSNYFKVEAGSSELEVYEGGALVHSAELNLPVNGYQTFAVYDFVAQAKSSILIDSFYDGDESLGRLFHAVPGAPELSLTDQDGNVLLGPVAFGEITNYIDLDDEDLEITALQLRTHEEGGEGEVLATYSELRGGGNPFVGAIDSQTDEVNVTLVAAGDEDSSLPLIAALDQPELGGFTLIADPDTDPQPGPGPDLDGVYLRVMHADVDGADTSYDVYLDDAEGPFVNSLAYGSASDYVALELEGGATSTFTVRDSQSDEELDAFDYSFEESEFGGFYTLTVFPNARGGIEEPETPLQVALSADDMEATPGQLGVRFFHAGPDFEELSLEIWTAQSQEDRVALTALVDFGHAVVAPQTPGTFLEKLQLSDDKLILAWEDGAAWLAAFFHTVEDAPQDTFIDALEALYQERTSAVNINLYLMGDEAKGVDLVALVNDTQAGGQSIRSRGSFSQ